jgi:nitric oxide synthase oxygenase domain/subunit
MKYSCVDVVDEGWKGAGSPFDVLPLAIKPANSEHVQLFEIPKEYVLEGQCILK